MHSFPLTDRRVETPVAHLHEAIPTLRVVDASAAAAWYARLGFAEDWRHQHEPGLPWFICISRPEGATLFLIEDEGDCSPRGNVFLSRTTSRLQKRPCR